MALSYTYGGAGVNNPNSYKKTTQARTGVAPTGPQPMAPLNPAAKANPAWAGAAPAVSNRSVASKAALGQASDMTKNALNAVQHPYGTESGPGILQQLLAQRMSGTDPAYEYAMKRGGDAIDNRMAAGGSFNSGARAQQQSDYAANMGAQMISGIDALAGGASGERQGQINTMMNQGLGLAGGQAGATGAYDFNAANAMNMTNQALVQLGLNKAGVDAQANQGLINNLLGAGSVVGSLFGKKGG